MAYAAPKHWEDSISTMLRVVCILERRNTMTMINEVLMNGVLYLSSLGILGLAWASLQKNER
jgi:hypothetical protein